VANTDAYALQRSDLNGFLFADVGVEASGMTLSVLSTLARLGVDPWQEAGRLAKLPRTAAVEGLARIIAAMPASLWSLADATAIAARLVALLPAHGGSPSSTPSARRTDATTLVARLMALRPGRGGLPGQPAPAASPRAKRWTVVLALLGIALAGLALNPTWHHTAAPDSGAAAPWSAGQPAPVAPSPAGHVLAGKSPR
jgi:hypothetical protein